MAAFREWNTGQVVVTDDPERIAFFERMARWVETVEPLQAVTQPSEPVGETIKKPEAVKKPASNANRATWVEYALSQGKTIEDGTTLAEIKSWF